MAYIKQRLLTPTLLLLALGWAPCPAALAQGELGRYERMEVHMGTKFHVALYAPDEPTAERGFAAAFQRIAALDQTLSDYRADSELSQLSTSAPHDTWVPVSDDLWRMLSLSHRLSEQSGGAFDVTVGPLTRLWRRARRQREAPSGELLDKARGAAGFQHMVLDTEHQRVRLTAEGMRLDLGGIAKGYAVQQAIVALREAGMASALVEGGGDMALGDPPPGSDGWRIAVAPLQANAPPRHFLEATRCGIATSGDFWQFIEIDGQRYSHILDPKTGMGVTHRSSVTVIAPDGETADALASALTVLEPEAGLELLQQYPGAEAMIVRLAENTIRRYTSPGFSAYLTSDSPALAAEEAIGADAPAANP